MSLTVKLELELAAGVWTNVSGDVIRDPIRWKRGITGSGPSDRVARPGMMTWTLDNTDQNAAGIADYYTPGHPNCVTGFQHGVRVRLWLADTTVHTPYARYVWAGRLKSVAPDAAIAGFRAAMCLAEDKFAVLATMDITTLALMEDASADALLDAVVAVMDDPPLHTDFDLGIDEYPFAFDDLGGLSPKGMSVAMDIINSELGYLYGRGDATDGETWRFENRYSRTLAEIALEVARADLRSGTDVVDVPSTLDQLFNDVDVQTIPRRVDAAATTTLVAQDAAIEVAPGETVRVFLDYQDPANAAEYVGGKDMSITPSTDWTANAAEDGSGADLTSAVSVTPSFFGSRVMLDIANTSSVTAYVRGATGDGLQIQGRGLYRYAAVTTRGRNQTSIDTFGPRRMPQPFIMPYQNDREVGQGAADFFAHIYGGLSALRKIQYASELDDAHLEQGVMRDIGDRLAIDEDVIGVAGLEAFIQSVEGELQLDGPRLYTWWGLAPADTSSVVIFDDPLAGRFDANAFGYL